MMRAASRSLLSFIASFTAVSCATEVAAPRAGPPQDRGTAVVAPSFVMKWMKENAVPFSSARVDGRDAELLPLARIVGDARVVGLGEATHGTHEFQDMKIRIFKLLVAEKGFNTFALEADWGEASRINEYLRTGRGDPYALLAGVHLWPWRTQEMLDFIGWMRGYNVAHPAAPVSFVGIDAQFPGMDMDTVLTFLDRHDHGWVDQAALLYECFRPYSNDEKGKFAMWYGTVGRSEQDACRSKLNGVYDHIVSQRSELVAATSTSEFDYFLQASRVVVQAEDVLSGRNPPPPGVRDVTHHARDGYMAENAHWWLARGGPSTRMVVWAHNAHVKSNPVNWSTGDRLRAGLGADYRPIGFRFYEGSFRAVGFADLQNAVFTLSPMIASSYEGVFDDAVGLPRFIMDIRPRAMPDSVANWFAGPLTTREIGAGVNGYAGQGQQSENLPAGYDAVIYFRDMTPTELLPPLN
jgi:erythromycin esterase